MTATLQPAKPTSRRALLAGAVGGIGALAATVIGRADPVRAEGQIIHVGDEWNDATSLTKVQNSANNVDVFQASSSAGGRGILGTSVFSYGVQGSSTSSIGVLGASGSESGVYAISSATAKPAAVGRSDGNSTGVEGVSGGNVPAAKANTGVFGYAIQDTAATGVRGESTIGVGVRGKATTGYAGFFDGRVFTTRYYELAEITTPNAPAANQLRLFARDSGGKTQLCVRFNTGAVQVIKTQP